MKVRTALALFMAISMLTGICCGGGKGGGGTADGGAPDATGQDTPVFEDSAQEIPPADATGTDVQDSTEHDTDATVPECETDEDCTPTASCEEAFCDVATQTCQTMPAEDGTPCDDGNSCTHDDACKDGVCASPLPSNDFVFRHPSGYTILDAAYYVVDSHLGSAVLGALGQINGCNIPAEAPVEGPLCDDDTKEYLYSEVTIGPVDEDSPWGRPALHLEWDFLNLDDLEEGEGPLESFTGLYISLNAQSIAENSLDGVVVGKVPMIDHVLNLDDLNHPLSHPGFPDKEKVGSICLRLRYGASVPLTARLELKSSHLPADPDKLMDLHTIETLFDVNAMPMDPDELAAGLGWRAQCFDLDQFTGTPGEEFDRTRAKEVAIVIPRFSLFPAIQNPDSGVLEIDEIWFEGEDMVTRGALLEMDDATLLDLLAFKAAVRMVRLGSRLEEIGNLPQDRDAFGNLMSVASAGFLLAALPVIVERGWMEPVPAAQMSRNIVKHFADCPDSRDAEGPIFAGYCKHRGIFYHFLGTDGLRKRNFDYPDSEIDESTNVVELSVIDTGLLLAGAVNAAVYFDQLQQIDYVDGGLSIGELTSSLLAEADWRWAYAYQMGQLFMAWNPSEPGVIPLADEWQECSELTGAYGFADDFFAPEGYFSSKTGPVGSDTAAGGMPTTLDYFTSESVIPNILALAAPLEHRPPNHLWSNWEECPKTPDWSGGVPVCSGSSGAMFIYQFDRLLGVPTDAMVTHNGVDLYESACAIHEAAISESYGTLRLPAAHETPYMGYTANWSKFTKNKSLITEEDVTSPPYLACIDGIAPYAWAGAFVCGKPTIQETALCALRRLIDETPVYHPMIGLADVFYPDLSCLGGAPQEARKNGYWVNFTSFGIDQGPILLGLHRALCSLDEVACPSLVGLHEVFEHATDNAAGASTGWIEGEWGCILVEDEAPCCFDMMPCGKHPFDVPDCPGAAPLCEGDHDSFPTRSPLHGQRAAHLLNKGTVLAFQQLHLREGPAELQIDYSLPSWQSDLYEVEVLLGDDPQPVSTLIALEGTADGGSEWDLTKTATTTFDVPASGEYSLRLHLAATPETSYGFQVDRILVHAATPPD